MPKLRKLPPTPTAFPPVERVALSIPEVAQATNLSKSTLYTCMKAGTLKFIKCGARRLVSVSEVPLFLARLAECDDAKKEA